MLSVRPNQSSSSEYPRFTILSSLTLHTEFRLPSRSPRPSTSLTKPCFLRWFCPVDSIGKLTRQPNAGKTCDDAKHFKGETREHRQPTPRSTLKTRCSPQKETIGNNLCTVAAVAEGQGYKKTCSTAMETNWPWPWKMRTGPCRGNNSAWWQSLRPRLSHNTDGTLGLKSVAFVIYRECRTEKASLHSTRSSPQAAFECQWSATSSRGLSGPAILIWWALTLITDCPCPQKK